jgi:hypothetical protein
VAGVPTELRPPPVLNYVERETRSDMAVFRDAGTTRVIAPRKAVWEMVLDWHWLIPIGCTVYLVAALQEGEINIARGVAAAVVAPVVLVRQVYTLWRRRVFEVTPDEVRVGYVRGSNPIWEDRWPRGAVGEVRVNRFDGRLLIRITGQDMKEYRVSRDRKATEAVAAVLDEAVVGYVRQPITPSSSAVVTASRPQV